MLSFAPMPPVPSFLPEEPVRPRPIRRKFALSPSQGLGVLGSAFLLLGVYLPFQSGSPGLASGDLSESGSAEAAVIALMAVLSFFLALRHCAPALAATAMIAQLAFASAVLLTPGKTEQPTAVTCSPDGTVFFPVETPRRHPNPGLGWYVLLLGPLVLLVAAVADDVLDARLPTRRPSPEYRPPLDGPSSDCV